MALSAVQVLERSNKSEYGLAAGVYSKDVNWVNSLSRYAKKICRAFLQDLYHKM